MARKDRYDLQVRSYLGAFLMSVLIAATALAAAQFAALTRFSTDLTLAPRAIYKEDVHRVAGAELLAVKIIGEDVHADHTVRTIGGVILQATAAPTPELFGKEIELRYNQDLPDGQRLQIKLDNRTFKGNLFDWALIPISEYANSPNTAVISLFGRPLSDDENTFSRSQRLNNHRSFWVKIHPDLKDTLIGFNSLLVDAMLLGGDPGLARKYTARLSPKINGWNSAAFNDAKSASASTKIKMLLDDADVNTYIFTDLDSSFTYSTQGDA
jgi:hypothetical protein